MRRTWPITMVLALAVAPAAADELWLGWETSAEYDSDVLLQDGGRDDFILRFGPTLEVEGERSRFSYRVEHNTDYEKYIDFSGFDSFRHENQVNFGYVLGPRVRFDVSNSFRHLPQLRSSTIDLVQDTDTSQIVLDPGSVTTDIFSATLTITPTSRVATTSQLSVIYRKFEDPTLDAQNTVSTGTLNQVTYELNERHQVGGGFRYSSRDFETGTFGERTDANTETWETFASWNWEIDSRSTFTAQLGPAFSSDDVDRSFPEEFDLHPVGIVNFGGAFGERALLRNPAACPPENVVPGGVILTAECLPLLNQPFPSVFAPVPDPMNPFNFLDPGGIPTNSPTFQALQAQRVRFDLGSPDDGGTSATNLFFRLGLNRDWSRLRMRAAWSRSDSQTQSLGSNTVVDSVFVTSNYDFSRRTRFRGVFRFTERRSDVDRESARLIMGPVGPIDEMLVPTPDDVPLIGPSIVGATIADTSFEQVQRTYNFQFRFIHEVGRRSTAFVELSLRRQENELDSVDDLLDFDSSFDSFSVSMGFHYKFRPIRF